MSAVFLCLSYVCIVGNSVTVTRAPRAASSIRQSVLLVVSVLFLVVAVVERGLPLLHCPRRMSATVIFLRLACCKTKHASAASGVVPLACSE